MKERIIILIIVLSDILIGGLLYYNIIKPLVKRQSPSVNEETSSSRLSFDSLIVTISTACILFTLDLQDPNTSILILKSSRIFFVISIIGSIISIGLYYIKHMGIKITEGVDMSNMISNSDLSILNIVFKNMKYMLYIFMAQILSLLSGIILLILI